MSAKCDPGMHDGARVDANYVVRGLQVTSDKFEVRPTYTTVVGSFACCDDHLGLVVALMTERHGRVLVQRTS